MMLYRYLVNNLTRPYIEGFAPAGNGRGILDFTVTKASRPEAQVNGNALKEDPGLSPAAGGDQHCRRVWAGPCNRGCRSLPLGPGECWDCVMPSAEMLHAPLCLPCPEVCIMTGYNTTASALRA